ncbi:fumarylacetoacetate hydrolase family protein, partial [Paraburkholderia heleia]|uniref:fumarylacetoacetate hydrolase family protein n=1 Tax=Paraburkholderia heleia TaxID=634127 RepID=UPI0005A92E56
MTYVFEPAVLASVPVAGSDTRFPVRRIYCVGRNYEAHAREMGHDPNREPPFFFSKPADAVLYVAPGSTAEFPYPAQSQNVHFEMELVAAIGKGGRDIPVADALDHVYGYALGLDMTRRDLQGEAKKLGRPWDTAKGFDHSAPIGPIHPVAKIGHLEKGDIWLAVNGEEKQRSDISQMIWPVADTIAFLS